MRTTGNTTRRLTTAALSGVAVLAIVGGSALIAPAANASTGTTYRCATTNGGTALVDFSSANGGLGLGSTGVVGIATGSDGVQIGLLHCAVVVGLGATPSTVLVGSPVPPATAPSSPTTPTVPVSPAPAEPTADTTGTTPTSPTARTIATPPESTSLADIRVGSSATTVYPAKDGYKDSVTFSIRGMTTSATSVPIAGSAVLRRGRTVIRTWKIDSSTSMLSWNGRVGSKVRAGFYTLTVVARSADGVERTTTARVRVSGKRLVQRTVVVRSKEIAHRTTAMTPARVLNALALGTVTVRIRTVATVHGAAKLVFYGNGSQSIVPLRNGTHTAKAVKVPKGLDRVSIGHDWKKGSATLTSLRAIFRYKRLV